MSDPQDSRSRLRAKQDLGERLRRVRTELYGEHGGPDLARLLGIPYRTWSNYEGGFTIPGEVLLALLDLTGVEPRWLLRGEGPAYRSPPGGEVGQQCPEGVDRWAGATSEDGMSPLGRAFP